MNYKERIDAIRARVNDAGVVGVWPGDNGEKWVVVSDSGDIDNPALHKLQAHARADIPFLLARIATLEAALGEAMCKIGQEYHWLKHKEIIDRLTATKEGREHE